MKRLLWLFVVAVALAGAALQANDAKPAEKADNSRCLVCHEYYEKEPFAAKHLKHNIGCEKCHGPSNKHVDDDKGNAPPDVMFPKDKITSSCFKCHSDARSAAREDHKPVWDDIKNNDAHCTECHGKHQLAKRTTVWDKATGKLIKKEGDKK